MTSDATNSARPVSALVVDDEPLARAGLRRMLAEIEWVACIGEAANGPAAVAAIDAQKPELVFLDIQMPGLIGTEVLAHVQHQPLTVFTTAIAEHAVTAFELGALDYLLKPFGEERLRATLERVRGAIGEPAPLSTLARFGDVLGRAPISRLFARSGRSIVPLAVSDIAWFEAVGDYIAAHIGAAHAGAAQHLLHVSLNQLELRLDPQRFARIHRAHIVNLDHVAAFRRDLNGNLTAELKDGVQLGVSRSKARELRLLAR